MLFNSIEFLFFFPIVTFLFFSFSHKYRWFVLLSASCLFYSAFIPIYIFILFFTILIDYVAGIYIEKSKLFLRKVYLILSLVCNLGILAYFKYYNFFIDNINSLFTFFDQPSEIKLISIILPIGLSFHTFQAMSYTIEVYRGNQKAEKHFGYYALYVMFYPQLVAGPIERPQNILHQFHKEKFFKYSNVVSGLKLMLLGIFKKVVIADRIAVLTDLTYASPHSYSSLALLLSVILFSFQIYCDFSGYSDVAIGSARVMGFDLMKNFNNPYSSTNISQFWSKWHISLSTWFRDYLYIPLGGNKNGRLITFRNILIVFLLSGLWHGANWTFLVWGGIHGLILIIYNLFVRNSELNNSLLNYKFYRVICIIFNFSIVSVAWVFFRSNNLSDSFYIIKSIPDGIMLFLINFLNFDFQNLLPVSIFVILLSVGFIFLLQFFDSYKLRITKFISYNVYFRWLFYYIIVFSILFFGVFEDKQFIYFQF
jgi:D-alanyl-lipoteichoic acid acyltransferase DltB (MBOAT superfamily)